jgi:mono/diheme cytochrome c family protein
LKPERASLSLLTLLVALLAGCDDNNMREGSRFKPYESSGFFADGRVARALPAGVVAQGETAAIQSVELTGRDASGWVATLPLPVDEPMLRRGQLLFNVFCANCHGPAGYGDGMIVQRGHPAPPSFHSDRLRSLPDGHLFNVISDGYGKMQPLGPLIRPLDRWPIVAYLRVLQASQSVPASQLPAAVRGRLDAEVAP